MINRCRKLIRYWKRQLYNTKTVYIFASYSASYSHKAYANAKSFLIMDLIQQHLYILEATKQAYSL